MTTATHGESTLPHQYIFPSISDSGSVIYSEANEQSPPQQSSKGKLSASRLRSLRRNRLIRDNHGTATIFGEESKYDDGIYCGHHCSNSDNDTIHDHMSMGIASSDPTVGYRNVTPESHQEYLRIQRQREMMRGSIGGGEDDSTQQQSHDDSYYHQLQIVMKEFSTMMESISSGWCASEENGQQKNETFMVGSTAFSAANFHQEEEDDDHVVVASSTFQSDPFDIIQDQQVAAIMKKNRHRGFHNSTTSIKSDTTHLRALEIVAKNKRRSEYRSFPDDESSMAYFRSYPAMWGDVLAHSVFYSIFYESIYR